MRRKVLVDVSLPPLEQAHMMRKMNSGIVEEEEAEEEGADVAEGGKMMKMTLISGKGDEGSSNIQH